MKIITKYPQLLDKVQDCPGLAGLIQDLWFLLPKERYQYNQQENNIGNLDDIFLSIPDEQHSSDDDGDIYT